MVFNIGEAIKQRRLELKLSQKAVADYLGITQQAYSKYENNLNSFNFETALKLGEILNISLDELGLDFRNQTPLSGKEQQIITQYRDLDQYGKETVDAVLECEHNRCVKQNSVIFRAASSKDNHSAEVTTTTKDFSKIKQSDDDTI